MIKVLDSNAINGYLGKNPKTMNFLTVALIVVALFMLLLYIFHNRIVLMMSKVTHLLFILGFLGMVSIAVVPSIYNRAIDGYLEQSYLGRQLKALDNYLTKLDETRATWQEQWYKIFGGEAEEAPAVPAQLYPSFMNFMCVSFMVVVGIVSLFLMLLSLYFKYTFLGYMNANKGLKRIKSIEGNMQSKITDG